MDFKKLGLSENYAARLRAKDIVEATSIQRDCFQSIVEGQSIMGLAKTGTGKTLAYLAPLVERQRQKNITQPGSFIVLLPTRELAIQVEDTLQLLLEDPSATSVMLGGQAEDLQLKSAAKATWWIATPGRFLDFLKRRQLPKIEALHSIILDEADRLLDMGFQDDIRAIIGHLPTFEQALFFSATLHLGVEEMAFELGADFEKKGQADTEDATVKNLKHSVLFVGENEKFSCLNHFLHNHGDLQVLIFSNYKDKARKLSSRLRGLGAKAECLNADLQQSRRTQIVDAFRKSKLQYLVASDLASRGIDIQDLDLVINYDLPDDPAVYVHRVGRTARAGKTGKALSFVGFEDSFRMERLEKFLGTKLEKEDFDLSILNNPFKRWPDSGEAPLFPEDEARHRSERPHDRDRSRQNTNKPRHQNKAHSRSSAQNTSTQRPKNTQSRNQSDPRKPHVHKPDLQKMQKPSLFKKIFRKLLGLVITLDKDVEHKDNKSKKRPYKRPYKKYSKNKNSARKTEKSTTSRADHPKKKSTSRRRHKKPNNSSTFRSSPSSGSSRSGGSGTSKK